MATQSIVVKQHKLERTFGIKFLPDNAGYTNRFAIPSESDPKKEYIMAQRKKSKEITCGCPGWINHRSNPKFKGCKHLKALGPALVKAFGGFYKGSNILPATPPRQLKAKDPTRTKLFKNLYKLQK